jgi:hypothetical protein
MDDPKNTGDFIDIVFDRKPGPESPRFVEVEDSTGRSINFGAWLQRPDGCWVIRVAWPPV